MKLTEYLEQDEIDFLAGMLVNPHEWKVIKKEDFGMLNIETLHIDHASGLRLIYTRKTDGFLLKGKTL